MEIFEDRIVLEIEYNGEDILRPMLLITQRTPWYERILRAPQGVLINFILVFLGLYFFGWVSLISITLAVLFSIVLSGFVLSAMFEWLGQIIIFLESKYRKKYNKVPRLRYRFILDHVGIRKESNRDVELSKWTEIKEAFETEHDILLSHYTVNVYYFPKWIFQDFDEMTYFKHFIQKRIGSKANF